MIEFEISPETKRIIYSSLNTFLTTFVTAFIATVALVPMDGVTTQLIYSALLSALNTGIRSVSKILIFDNTPNTNNTPN